MKLSPLNYKAKKEDARPDNFESNALINLTKIYHGAQETYGNRCLEYKYEN